MAFHIRVELRGGEIALDHVALELRHVDTVGGKTTQRLVEGGRNIAHLKDEGGDDRTVVLRGLARLSRKDDKSGRGMRLVLDVLGQNFETVDLRRQT